MYTEEKFFCEYDLKFKVKYVYMFIYIHTHTHVSVYSQQSYRPERFRPMARITIWSRVANVLKDIPVCLVKIVLGVT